MEYKNDEVEVEVSQHKIDECIATLEKLLSNTNQIFELSEKKRVALLKAAGLISRPNREEFSRRKKDAQKTAKRKMIAKDRHARKETGIRSSRESAVFTAPKLIAVTKESENELESP